MKKKIKVIGKDGEVHEIEASGVETMHLYRISDILPFSYKQQLLEEDEITAKPLRIPPNDPLAVIWLRDWF
jgi:hypothetical protein